MKKRDIEKFQKIVLNIVDSGSEFDNNMPEDVWKTFQELVRTGDKNNVNRLFKVSIDLVRDSIKEEIKKRFEMELVK